MFTVNQLVRDLYGKNGYVLALVNDVQILVIFTDGSHVTIHPSNLYPRT